MRIKRYKYPWKPWFAWRPVTINGTTYWLEYLWARQWQCNNLKWYPWKEYLPYDRPQPSPETDGFTG